MIDGIGDLIKATVPEDNTLLEKEEKSDIDRLLDELKIIEDIVTYENSPSADPLRGMTVSTTPTVNDIIGYRGNLNAIIPAGFIMLHNDLTGVLKNSIDIPQGNSLKKDDSFNLKDLFEGDGPGLALTLKNLFNETGIATLGKMAGYTAGVAGLVDNIAESFGEDGKFDWGYFAGETLPAAVAGAAVGILTGNPALGSLVFGAISALDLWGGAVEETNKNFNTIQTALNDESSEEYERYHDLIENYKTNMGSSTSWMEGSADDTYDYGHGSMGAWAYADNLISQLEDYLLNGERSVYASLFTKPTEEIFTIKDAIDFLSELNPDSKLRSQGDISTPDNKHGFQEWLYAGYDMTSKEGRDEFYIHFQQSLDSLGLTLDAFTSSELDPAAVKTEEDLFIWNLQRLLNSPDKENFQWEWYPNKPSTPETAFTPEEAPIPYSDIQDIYIPHNNPERQASFEFEDEINRSLLQERLLNLQELVPDLVIGIDDNLAMPILNIASKDRTVVPVTVPAKAEEKPIAMFFGVSDAEVEQKYKAEGYDVVVLPPVVEKIAPITTTYFGTQESMEVTPVNNDFAAAMKDDLINDEIASINNLISSEGDVVSAAERLSLSMEEFARLLNQFMTEGPLVVTYNTPTATPVPADFATMLLSAD